jgi:hypothetical protein
VCLRGTVDGACAWCAGGYMPNKCMDEQAAKFLPSFVTDCKVGSACCGVWGEGCMGGGLGQAEAAVNASTAWRAVGRGAWEGFGAG